VILRLVSPSLILGWVFSLNNSTVTLFDTRKLTGEFLCEKFFGVKINHILPISSISRAIMLVKHIVKQGLLLKNGEFERCINYFQWNC